MTRQKEPFNPLDKINLGKSVAIAILSQPYQPMPSGSFEGVGVYALYYFGKNSIYDRISDYNNASDNNGWPIYVGKAIPKGGRKGVFSKNDGSKALHGRILKHCRSVTEVENLDLNDFKCRYLTVDPIWIPLGEQLLIDRFKPIWNSVIDGFGNNDPGTNRYNGRMSDWDKLHPGREWTMRMSTYKEQYDLDSILKKIKNYQEEQYQSLV